MDLALTEAERAFRDEVRAFLRENLTPELRAAGAAQTSVFSNIRDSSPWQKILHAKGWAAPGWPIEYGGAGWTEAQRYIFASECARCRAPSLAPMGLRMVGPVIMRFGTPAQKARYLPRILSGDDYWCQGYSEPGAGSDLAALALRAEIDGDDYVLSGSKIWTTHAHWASHIFCLVRTDATGRPQKGITFLLLDMKTPGIAVAPIITLAGEHEVNQVFFDNVRVSRGDRLGAENDGWSVAKYLLEFERGGGGAAGLRVTVERLQALAAADEALRDDANGRLRARLAALEIEIDAIEMTEHRVLSALAAGVNPGPASSLLKILSTETMQRLDEAAIEIAGVYGFIDQFAWRETIANESPVAVDNGVTAMSRYLNNRAASIYGGSNEIQRNIIARLILGL